VFDPKLNDPHPESSQTHPQRVYCARHQCDAEIVVAQWPNSEEGWTDWRVIDCSELPQGAVRCGMDCLSQARLKTE
jgi:hypothetical protein